MLKFPNVETLDCKLNKQILNQYRDRVCTTKDIKHTFKDIQAAKANNNSVWLDEYNYLLLTIKRLKKRGCNVEKLEQTFNKCEAKLFKTKETKR